MKSVYKNQVPKDVKNRLKAIEKLEKKIATLDYDFCKCIIANKC